MAKSTCFRDYEACLTPDGGMAENLNCARDLLRCVFRIGSGVALPSPISSANEKKLAAFGAQIRKLKKAGKNDQGVLLELRTEMIRISSRWPWPGPGRRPPIGTGPFDPTQPFPYPYE